MAAQPTRSMRPYRASRGMLWLLLWVILFGTIVSSVGGMYSHGIAAISAVSHVSATSSVTEYDHAHSHAGEDGHGDWVEVSRGASADHPHNGADHSHDKVHALPITWSVAAPQLPVWIGQGKLRIEMIGASRLERPPLG